MHGGWILKSKKMSNISCQTVIKIFFVKKHVFPRRSSKHGSPSSGYFLLRKGPHVQSDLFVSFCDMDREGEDPLMETTLGMIKMGDEMHTLFFPQKIWKKLLFIFFWQDICMEKMCFLKSIEQTLSKVFSFQEFESQPCKWKHSLFHLKTCFHFLKKPEFGACPESHPWAFARGSRCCSRPLRRTGGNDTSACPPTSDKEASPVLGFTDPGEYLFYGKLSVVGCLKIGKFFRGLLRGFRLCCLPGRCGVLLVGKRCNLLQIPNLCQRNHSNSKTFLQAERTNCPASNPGALWHGTKCCQSKERAESCPTFQK